MAIESKPVADPGGGGGGGDSRAPPLNLYTFGT